MGITMLGSKMGLVWRYFAIEKCHDFTMEGGHSSVVAIDFARSIVKKVGVYLMTDLLAA